MLEHPIDDRDRIELLGAFYARETELLDDRKFSDWLALLTDDFTYQVPATFTTDDAEIDHGTDAALYVDETRASLTNLWATRHSPKLRHFAWGEMPPQRVRRFVTGIRFARDPADPACFAVRANVLLSFVRQSDPANLMPCGRRDVIRIENGTPLLAKRVVTIDTAILTTTHLRFVI